MYGLHRLWGWVGVGKARDKSPNCISPNPLKFYLLKEGCQSISIYTKCGIAIHKESRGAIMALQQVPFKVA